MKKSNKSKRSLILATAGLLISCVDLIASGFENTSIVLFCSLITIWICSIEDYKKNNKKDE